MTAEFIGKLLEILLRVALGLGIIFAVMYVLRKTEAKKAKPETTLEARISAKRADGTPPLHYVAFDLENGAHTELRVPPEIYALLAAGDTGRLTFKGEEFVRFERTL